MLHTAATVIVAIGVLVSGQPDNGGAGGSGAFPFPVPWELPDPRVISDRCLFIPPGKDFPEGWLCPDGVSPPTDFRHV